MRHFETQNPDYFETNGCVSFFSHCLKFSREMRQMRHEKAIFCVSHFGTQVCLKIERDLIILFFSFAVNPAN